MKQILLLIFAVCTLATHLSAQTPNNTPDLVVMLGGAVYFREGSSVIQMADKLQEQMPHDSISYVAANVFKGGQVKRKIREKIREHQERYPQSKVVLYGYSIGADYLLKLQRKLYKKDIKVDLLLTVDAVGRRARNIRPNVKHQLNLFQETGKGEFFGYDFNAWLHGRPNKGTTATQLININVEPLDLTQLDSKKYEVVAHKNLKNITAPFALWYIRSFLENKLPAQAPKDWLALMISVSNNSL